MTMPKLRVAAFEHACQEGYTWLNAISRGMNHPSRVVSYHALRGVLHALRDRLPVNEAHHLGAQLPMMIRAVYFEGYHPAHNPVKMHHDEFLQFVTRELQAAGGANPRAAVRAVLDVVAQHVSAGELEHVVQALPADLQTFFAAPAS